MDCDNCWLADRCNRLDKNSDFCKRRHKLDRLYGMSLLSERQKRRTTLFLDADNADLAEFRKLAEIQNGVVDFVDSGKNLYLHSSNCGNGKTSWAIKIAQSYLDKIWLAADTDKCHLLFISVPRFLLALKDNITNRSEYVDFIKQHIMEADLVVWDDIAAKTGTEFELNHLLSLIDGRLALNKSNIYTTNLGANEMYNALGERLASRICQYSVDIELHGADKRNLGRE